MGLIEEKYRIKDEIDHILDRSGMWIGSTVNELIQTEIFIPSKNIFKVFENVPWNQGLNKLIDEVFSNAIDEYRRSKAVKKESLFDIKQINVTINQDGYCIIEDDGGIPIVKHAETGLYVPKMIFGVLRTSSNYDDTIDKEWVGTNGLGSKISNIFSTKFIVETNDGKNYYRCVWVNNMHDVLEEVILPASKGDLKTHGTKISFQIDLERFELDKFELGNIRLFQKHCIDSAAANPGLIINFKSDVAEGKLDSSWKFEGFKEYVNLFRSDDNNMDSSIEYKSGNDTIILVFGAGINDVGFVNGALCSNGSHIKKVQKQIIDKMLYICKKEDMDLITEKDILSRFTVFVNATIYNPQYDSQAKTCLTSKIDSKKLYFDDRFLSKLKDSYLFELIKYYYDIKYKEQKIKENKKLNNIIKNTKSKKLIVAPIKDKHKNELWIFEGNSASSGFRKFRTHYQSAYLLRGKIKNTLNISKSEIVENQELREIISVLGLKFDDPSGNMKNCTYDKIVFCTDADTDGSHICGLLIAFFAKYFKELFLAGKIYRALSPVITLINGNKTDYYYNMTDYEKNIVKYNSKWEVNYTKGLGGLSDKDYSEMLQTPKFLKLILSAGDMDQIRIWFDKDTEIRKNILMDSE